MSCASEFPLKRLPADLGKPCPKCFYEKPYTPGSEDKTVKAASPKKPAGEVGFSSDRCHALNVCLNVCFACVQKKVAKPAAAATGGAGIPAVATPAAAAAGAGSPYAAAPTPAKKKKAAAPGAAVRTPVVYAKFSIRFSFFPGVAEKGHFPLRSLRVPPGARRGRSGQAVPQVLLREALLSRERQEERHLSAVRRSPS